jgi:Rhodopirellula transposase DDE domain
MNERVRRMFAASEALQLGYGGISRISQVCGLSRVTITKGIQELDKNPLPGDRVRREGGGRSEITKKDPGLPKALETLVEPLTRGDPESSLRWTCKSTRVLSGELTKNHHQVSHEKVAQLLRGMNYSLQGNRKTEEGDNNPDRNAQFEHINDQVNRAMKMGVPVISVDTKKKELIGNYYNKGQQYRKSKFSRKVNGHDFPDPDVPRAYPYGVYDLRRNTGFVNVGTDHDTGAFAVASIRGWWNHEGKKLYPKTNRIVITADGGGSNGYRHRLWKIELQEFANETGLSIAVSHFPPGTSKWNKVEHRLFSFISSNWRGEPLQDYETIVQLIAHTTTAKGLTVTCRLDQSKYPTGRKVTDEEFAVVNLKPHAFHGEWNYTICPRREL